MDFVYLHLKRNRGWPSPDDSWGLSPMFGDDGWCRSCGMPLREQCGPLTMRRAGMARPEGAWVPNWRFDALCVSSELSTLLETYDLDLRPIAWASGGDAPASQVVLPTVQGTWFDPEELYERTVARHGIAGGDCAACGRWRWMPLPLAELPPFVGDREMEVDAAASPEWFGAGHQSYRRFMLRRNLAQLIADESPKDFVVVEIA